MMIKRMVPIELTYEEIALLYKILESYLSDLRVEIGGTDVFAFKAKLKEEEAFIKDLLQRLDATHFMMVA